MGYHHFHLLAHTKEPASRTKELLFAKISREQFNVVAFSDHSVFKTPSSTTDELSDERKKLWEIFHAHITRGLPPGSFFIPASITTSGHSMYVVSLADEYASVVQAIDPRLDDPLYIQEMYQRAGIPCPTKPKLSWHFEVLDFGLLDIASGTFFIHRYGPN